MGICGRIDRDTPHIQRALRALQTGRSSTSIIRDFAAGALAACDDASLAEDPERDLWCVFDGRIDNRESLRGALGGDADRLLGTARHAIAAYVRWGDDFCDHIIGDYACAIWDGRRRRLVMATDPGALRTLFFTDQGGGLLFASEQRGLWADADVVRELDREAMATWLAMLPREPLRTFFRNIYRVPPGQRVIWEGGKFRLERWWKPEEIPPLTLRDDADYAAAVRECFEEAVRCRIAGREQIGTHLSGGLDSASVTAVAARQLASQGRSLLAFTAAPRHATADVANRFADEWPHASLVAAHYANIEHIRIDNDDRPILDALDVREPGNDWPVLNASNTVWLNAIERVARDRGVEVLLTGAMGNMTLSYDGSLVFDNALRSGNPVRIARAIRDRRRGGQRGWLGIAGEIASAVLPLRARRGLRRAFGRPELDLYDYSAARPDFLRDTGVEQRAEMLAGNLTNFARGDSRALRLAVLDRSDHRGHQAMSTRRLFGIDTRDPTSDRRLIELTLSIPDEPYVRGGVPRALVRGAMRGILPQALLDERRSGLQAADWRVGFDTALPALRKEVARLRNSDFARECLDLDRMEQMLDRWPGPNDRTSAAVNEYLCAFSRGLTAGRFIRRMEGGNG